MNCFCIYSNVNNLFSAYCVPGTQVPPSGPYTFEEGRTYVNKQLSHKVESNSYHTENEDEEIESRRDQIHAFLSCKHGSYRV